MPRRPRQLPPWAAPLAVGAVGLTGLAALALLPDDVRLAVSPGCPFRAVTGLDCPGCGGTRAVLALLDGDLRGALGHNVLTVLLLPLLGWAWLGWLRVRLGWRERAPDLPAAVSMGIAVALTTFMVLRNLPLLPFTYLASTPVS